MQHKILKDLVDSWHESGLENGDVVLLHSSLSMLLRKLNKNFNTRISPAEVLHSIRAAIGKEGTLVVPLFNFKAYPEHGFFDIRHTPSHMGILTETVRKLPEAVRTGHPIYSFCAIGKRAEEFKNIDNNSGYGPDSPFAKIKELGGKIAIIGLTDQNSMTSYHFVEEQNEVDYRYHKNFTGTYINHKGEKTRRTYSLFVRNLKRGIQTDVNRMMDYLWKIGAYKGNKPTTGYGMRTIDFNCFYEVVDTKIKQGKARNFLYSIKKEA